MPWCWTPKDTPRGPVFMTRWLRAKCEAHRPQWIRTVSAHNMDGQLVCDLNIWWLS